jgi:DNA-binding MarR family transcriptional regulator
MKGAEMGTRIGRDAAISETMQSLRRIFKAIQNYSQEISREFGITVPQLWALKTISQHEGLSLSELGKGMYLHPSTITGLIDRLEKKGFVLRERDQVDRRVIKIRLTAPGAVLVKKSPNPIQGKMIHGLRRLKWNELNSIFSAMRKLVEIMEAENIKATFFFDEE